MGIRYIDLDLLGLLSSSKIVGHGVYAWGTLKRRRTTVGYIEKSELKGRAVGGRSTYQRLVTPPFVITPSEIPFYMPSSNI